MDTQMLKKHMLNNRAQKTSMDFSLPKLVFNPTSEPPKINN